MAPFLLTKILGVKVTPSVTSVESSGQFWRKICQKFGVFANPDIRNREGTFFFDRRFIII